MAEIDGFPFKDKDYERCAGYWFSGGSSSYEQEQRVNIKSTGISGV